MPNRRRYIRANQGHSIKSAKTEELLKPVHSPAEVEVAVHGTKMEFIESILSSGLSKMSRNHIHMATQDIIHKGAIGGVRPGSNVSIYIDVAAAMRAGIKFFLSDNSVLLTEGLDETGTLPPSFFTKVIVHRTGEDLLDSCRSGCSGT